MYNTGGSTFYWKFYTDGVIASYTNAGFWNQDVSGIYAQDGVKVKGSFVNLGDGEVDATLSENGNTTKLDFIEYWRDPAKYVRYVGMRW